MSAALMPPPPPGTELLDDPGADPDLVRVNLRNMSRANRWFGGWSALRFGLGAALEAVAPRPISMLDVGSGAADLLQAAVAWCRARGFAVQPMGVEPHPAAAVQSKPTGLAIVRARGARLPFGNRSIDLVTVSQVVHHLGRRDAIDLLRDCARVARLAVVVADLERAPLALTAFGIGARLLRFDPVTRADGRTSLRRGFTPAELAQLLHDAGLEGSVTRRPFFRIVAVCPALTPA